MQPGGLLRRETEEGWRCALCAGALKGVGDARWSCWSRARGAGSFKSLGDFAKRVDPGCSTSARSRRWRVPVAFDTLDDNRAGVFAAAETILAVARSWSNKTSGQGGLFSESGSRAAVRSSCAERALVAGEPDRGGARRLWLLFLRASARYFQHLAKSFGARGSRPNSTSLPAPGWARRSRRLSRIAARVRGGGSRYLMATISDKSAQTLASCFEDSAAKGPGGLRPRRRLRC